MRLRWWIALPASAFGGLLLDAAAPAIDWWPAGLLGAALIMASIWQQGAWRGLLFGLVGGAAFWLPHISWLTLYLGPIPWLALSAVMIAWFGLFGVLGGAATRGLSTLGLRARVLVPAQALTIAGLWVAREQLQSTWPYGGFAWGRLAHSQAEGPLLQLVSWQGFAGLSGLLALASALVVAALFCAGRVRSKVLGVLLVLAALVCLAFVPEARLQQVGTTTIGAVQGNSKSGIFDDRENGDVFRDHVTATESLLDDLETNGERVDLIVWPENSGEFQLPEQNYRMLEMRRLSERAGAPIVVGSVLQDSEDVYTNSSIVIDEEGDTGLRYDKRRPVPFAEYMPNRAFFRALVPDLVDLVQLDYQFGQRSAVLPVQTESGLVLAGIAICFDIIFDDHAVAMVGGGAELILAQTNNADFGRTDESAQQLQIARLRAVETGRAIVNISTVGTSAVVYPDGSEAAGLVPFTEGFMVAEVPQVTGETPALRLGALIAGSWIAIGLIGAATGVLLPRLRARARA